MIEALDSLDRSFFLFLNSLHLNWLDPVMVFFSGQLVWLPMVLFAVWSAWKKLGGRGAAFFTLFLLLAIVASDVTSSYVIKNIVTRLRPCREAELLPLIYNFGQKCGGRFGFVSSHAANSVALVLFSLRALSLQKVYHIIGWATAGIVGFSRIYLGVHYPGDIIAGALIGAGWGYLLVWAFRNKN